MKSLNKNWFIEKPLDYEYKKYQLLAYLQTIQQHFNHTQLYPTLNDLIFHYNSLQRFKTDKSSLTDAFPLRLSGADVAEIRLAYEKIVEDDDMMSEIERIINFALNNIHPAIKEGKEIHDFVESRLNIEEIGVLPLYPYHGYLLLRNGDEKGTRVYEYTITLFESEHDKYRGVHTSYITNYNRHFLHNTPESIRKDLIDTRRQTPNPAVYQVESDITFPLENTLLPIAKKKLVKKISILYPDK